MSGMRPARMAAAAAVAWAGFVAEVSADSVGRATGVVPVVAAEPPAAGPGVTFVGRHAQDTPGPGVVPDDRFGTVGATREFPWRRFYNAEWEHLDSFPDANRLYTLGKLEPRADGLDWCRRAPGVCFVGKRADQLAAYERIFEAEKPHIADMVAHCRSAAPAAQAHAEAAARSIHFVVGNEPNFYPYVAPEIFAAVYKRYRDYIEGPPPAGLGCGECEVHAAGALLLNPYSRASFAGALAGGLADAWHGIKSAFGSRDEIAFLPWVDWTRRFLSALDSVGAKADVFDAHVYYVDARVTPFPGLGPPLFRIRSDPRALDTLCAILRGHGAPPVWIGEFGSVQPFQGAPEAVRQMDAMVAKFRSLPQVERWFWYAAAGKDPKFPSGRMRFWKSDWSFSAAPEAGLYRNPQDTSTRTPVGAEYLRLMRQR